MLGEEDWDAYFSTLMTRCSSADALRLPIILLPDFRFLPARDGEGVLEPKRFSLLRLIGCHAYFVDIVLAQLNG
jgi:hypothetical protein